MSTYGAGEAVNLPIYFVPNIPLDEHQLEITEPAVPEISRTRRVLHTARLIGEVLVAAKDDLTEAEGITGKVKTSASGVGVTGTLGVGFFKLPSGVPLMTTMSVFEKTGSPVVAGLAGGLSYGALSLVGTQVLSYGVNRFPRALQKLDSNFPNAAKNLSDILPGFKATQEREHNSKLVAVLRKVGNVASTHIRRSITAYTVSTPFMLEAGLKKQNALERLKLSGKLSADSASLVGLASIAVAEAVQSAGGKHPELLAHHVQHEITNPFYYIGATALLIGSALAVNKFKSKNDKESPA